MYFRWTGKGILAPFIILAGEFGVTRIAGARYGPAYVAAHSPVVWIGLSVGGFLCWWMGKSLNSDEPGTAADPQTQTQVNPRRTHTLFGVPMEWYGVAAMIAGLVCAVSGSPVPAGFSRLASGWNGSAPSQVASPTPGDAGSPGLPPSNPDFPPDSPIPPVSMPGPAAPSLAPAYSAAATPAAAPPAPQPISTVLSSERRAVRLYPKLGVAKSDFNKKFLKLYKKYKEERPAYFVDPDWPVNLAREVADGGHGAGAPFVR